MDNTLKRQLQYLGLYTLAENWDAIMKEAGQTRLSHHRFLTQIVEKEYAVKGERARFVVGFYNRSRTIVSQYPGMFAGLFIFAA